MKASSLFYLGLLAILIGLSTLASSSLSQGEDITLIDQTYHGQQLSAEIQAANVNIVSHAGAGIHVLAVQRGGQSGDFTVTVTEENGVVVVRDELLPRLRNVSLTYTISVPESSTLELRMSSGNLSLDGVKADATIDTRSGNVGVQRYEGNLSLHLTSGNVEIESSTLSPALVRSGSGNIRVRSSSGPLTLHSNSGNITVEGAQDGAVRLSGNSGNIELSGQLPDDSLNIIRQGSGNITVRLKDSNVRVEAQTVSGNVSSQLDLRDGSSSRTSLRGTLGNGSASLSIELTSGNIRLEPY